jgi:hypothetical protein
MDVQTTTYYRGFKNIVIKGSPLYQTSIVEQLEKVWRTWTGWSVLRGIIDSGKTVTIVPYSVEDQKTMGRENAFSRPKSARAASPYGFSPYRGSDDPRTPKDERFETVPFLKGSGGGSDDEVHFSVDTFQALPTCSKTVTSNCMPPMFAQNRAADDTLVHELVHSFRHMRGQQTLYPTRTKGYANEEEYFAILVQNIYASEKGMTLLRRDHKGWAAQPGSLSTSEGFLGRDQRPLNFEQLENRLLVRKFTNECFGLCKRIQTHVSAAFNPIGEYLRNPTQYPYDPRLAWGAPART